MCVSPTGQPGSPARWSRRAALAALGGVVAAACSSTAERANDAARPTTSAPSTSRAPRSRETAPPTSQGPPAETVPPPETAPPETEPPEPEPPEPAAGERGEIVDRYRDAVATEWGTHIGGLVTHVGATGTLALTFDACGGPGGSAVDRELVDLLVREEVAATLFLNHRWIDANPGGVDELAAHPWFELANHGTRHVPLSIDGRSAYGIAGTRSVAEVVDEVGTNHDRLAALTGRAPRWFRPGTAYYDDVAVRIANDIGEHATGFAVNGDAGATASAGAVTSALTGAPDRGIVLAHMNQPSGDTAAGVTAALPALRQRGVRFVTLSEAGPG